MTHWPKTPVAVGGHRFDMCFTLGAIAEAQQRFDHRGLEANLLEAMPTLTLANVRILFPCTLRKYHRDLDFASAQRLVTWEAVYAIAGALMTAWHAAAPEPLQGEAGKRKNRPSAKAANPLTRDQQWQRLWSLAVYDLRLTTAEFYDLTVGQLDALIRRRERDIEEREFMPAQIAACVVNFSMGRPKEPVSTKDFMPSEWAKNPDSDAHTPARGWKRMTPKRRELVATEIRASMEMLMRGQNAG
jgi:hypothetical protein